MMKMPTLSLDKMPNSKEKSLLLNILEEPPEIPEFEEEDKNYIHYIRNHYTYEKLQNGSKRL